MHIIRHPDNKKHTHSLSLVVAFSGDMSCGLLPLVSPAIKRWSEPKPYYLAVMKDDRDIFFP